MDMPTIDDLKKKYDLFVLERTPLLPQWTRYRGSTEIVYKIIASESSEKEYIFLSSEMDIVRFNRENGVREVIRDLIHALELLPLPEKKNEDDEVFLEMKDEYKVILLNKGYGIPHIVAVEIWMIHCNTGKLV